MLNNIMNYTNLDEAYKIHHIRPDTYDSNVKYSQICIYCNNPSSIPLMLKYDGGIFRHCNKCKKNFRAIIMNNAVNNFSYATHNLRGTN
jgi:hypothetical protein